MSEITPERSGYCMLQLGLPTLIETRTLSECAALCRELRLDFIELNMNLPQYQLNVLDIPLMKNIAARYGVFYTIHLDENLNVSDFNPISPTLTGGLCRKQSGWQNLSKSRLSICTCRAACIFTLPDKKVFLFSNTKNRILKVSVISVQCVKRRSVTTGL